VNSFFRYDSAERRLCFVIVMLSGVMPSVVVLNVVALEIISGFSLNLMNV
jgi:hypothetical protein